MQVWTWPSSSGSPSYPKVKEAPQIPSSEDPDQMQFTLRSHPEVEKSR